MFNTTRAVQNFIATSEVWQASSVTLAAAAAVCFILAANKGTPLNEVTDELQKKVTETGLGRSSTYNYIGRGRKLAAKLMEDNPTKDGVPQGIVFDVFETRSPAIATTAIVAYLANDSVTSADRLDVYLGGQPRALARAAKRDEPTTRHPTPEKIIQTFEDATAKNADELFAELIASAPLGTLRRWNDLMRAELAKRSPRGPKKRGVQRAGRAHENGQHASH